jgi:hypothetical protein
MHICFNNQYSTFFFIYGFRMILNVNSIKQLIFVLNSVGLGRIVAGIAGSNPARSMDICLCLYMLCCPVNVEALRRADHSFKGVLLRM